MLIPPKYRWPLTAAAGAFFAAILVLVFSGTILSTTSEGVRPSVVARRLSPAAKAGVPAEVDPGKPVEFRFELRNIGATALRDLVPQLDCSCQLTDPFPNELGAGQSALLAFKVLSPRAGVRRYRSPSLRRTSKRLSSYWMPRCGFRFILRPWQGR